MTVDEFVESVSQSNQPMGISPILSALWYDAKGDFEKAHEIAQSKEGTQVFDRLHAYLHRKEGDDSNAGYWYRRAREPMFTGSLEDEWKSLVAKNLE